MDAKDIMSVGTYKEGHDVRWYVQNMPSYYLQQIEILPSYIAIGF
jgi:hypothetical protein